MFEFSTAVVFYCMTVAAVFIGLWLWYDRRDHHRFEQERRRTTFHCVRCDCLYSASGGTEVAPCPGCGHENSRLRF